MKSHSSCILLVAFWLFMMVEAAAQTRPNVILIVADDLGYGGLGCYGNEWLETPHIDQLAREGIRFSEGHASHPTCQPSRIALLSGQYAPRTGGYRVKNHHKGQEHLIRYQVPELTGMSLDKISLAEAFKAGGYTTALFGKWHAGNYSKDLHPRYHGFDVAYECNSHYDSSRSDPVVDLPEGQDFADFFTMKAVEFMEASVEEAQPFFLYLPYYLVHAPLETRQDYIEHFEAKLQGHTFAGRKAGDVPTLAAMTKHLDDCVGRITAALEHLDIAEDTIVVFTSDNGSFNENFTGGLRGTKGDVYEGGLKVPYIFKWKGAIDSGAESDARITHIDLYPTLIDLAGVDRPDDYILDGLSLEAYLRGETSTLQDRPIVCYYPKYAQYQQPTKRWRVPWRNVLYSGDYKLREDVEYGEVELYHLKSDPTELMDLAKSHPEVLERLQRELQAWKQSMGVGALVPNPNYSLD